MRLYSERTRFLTSLQGGVRPLASKYIPLASPVPEEEEEDNVFDFVVETRRRVAVQASPSPDPSSSSSEDGDTTNIVGSLIEGTGRLKLTWADQYRLCQRYYETTLDFCESSPAYPQHYIRITPTSITAFLHKLATVFLRWSLNMEKILRARASGFIIPQRESQYRLTLITATQNHWLGIYTRICNLCHACIRRHPDRYARLLVATELDKIIRHWARNCNAMARPLNARCTTASGEIVTISLPHLAPIVRGLICFLYA